MASRPVSFQLGSGASTNEPNTLTAPNGLAEAERPKPGRSASPAPVFHRVRKSLHNFSAVAVIIILLMMMPASHAGNRDFNYRIPPAWSPEHENSYSFRAYLTDISIWVMLTDLQPHQQCAAIVMRLGGAAREMAIMVSPQEMMMGGVQNGNQVDPVTYILTALHARFSALEEESRLTCMTEMLAFARRPGENINALLARYETVRQRANVEGQFVMSVEGCSLQILRACGLGAQHLFTLLQPFQGQLPRTDAQFNELCTQLRRYGHISEGTPGNIASSLHGNRQARPGAYLAGTDHQALQEAAQRSSTSGGVASFFGNNSGTNPGGHWDSLLPQQPMPGADPFAAWTNDDTAADIGSYWATGGGRTAEAWTYPDSSAQSSPVYGADYECTDADTSSDDGEAVVANPNIARLGGSRSRGNDLPRVRKRQARMAPIHRQASTKIPAQLQDTPPSKGQGKGQEQGQ